MTPLCWDAFSKILEPCSAPVFDSSLVVAFSLPTLADLHFLDHHALKLAARLEKKAKLLVDRCPEPWELARLEVCCLTRESARFGHIQQVIPYSPGMILHWLRRTAPCTKILPLWRDYLTSVDHEFCPPTGSTLEGSWPHLRLGLVKGIDLFQSGEFYAAHEDWESLWMRLEEGPERSVLQGLIQLCGAYIHRLKGRKCACQTMWEKAQRNLGPGRSLDWIDIGRLVACSGKAMATPLEAHIEWPTIPLINCYRDVPRKHR